MADTLNAQVASLSASTATAKLNEEIVTQTLDTVNKYGGKSGGKSRGMGSMSDTYDLSKKVLSSVYEGKGTIADTDG